jgi:N-acetylmuramic acid 6-phosphate (MurNAc-6-P) etherase
VSISEQSNALTVAIDATGDSPAAALEMLRLVDLELCAGLSAPSTVRVLDAVAAVVRRWLAHDASHCVTVIASGAGTSGRISHLVARRANAACADGRVRWRYLCAGGDKALIEAQEHSEDNVALACADLEPFLAPTAAAAHELVLYVGVTCGLSAPYVAAQLDACMRANDAGRRVPVVPILMGFNPVAAARNVVIERWDGRTFRDVALALEKRCADGRHFLINPIVGPEAITGSTRMKGGSATKILLDTLADTFLSADRSAAQLIAGVVRGIAANYARMAAQLPPIMASAARSLRAGGHLFYLGVDSLGLWSIVDASECPPTFGAVFGDVHGFVAGGWRAAGNVGGDLSQLPETAGKRCYRISVDDFRSDVKLSAADTVLFLCHRAFADFVPFDVAPASSFSLTFGDADAVDHDLACKLSLNAVSTFAWVANGKVFGNRMIDLAISNDKLFARAKAIVRDVLRLTDADADAARIERAVLRAANCTAADRSIVDSVDVDALRAAPVWAHVEAAVRAKDAGVKVVPTAVLLASGLAASVSEAQQLLASNVLRTLVERAQQQAQTSKTLNGVERAS